MVPFILAGIVIAAAGTAAYKAFATTKENIPDKDLGKFAIWGLPNTGKSTFIGHLLRKPSSEVKEATTARTIYTDIPSITLNARTYRIREIADMPGTQDRLNDWLKMVKSHDHLFYLFDLSRLGDNQYITKTRNHIARTCDMLRLQTTTKRLHIIASHVDQSEFSKIDATQVNNELQNHPDFRRQIEPIGNVAGYVYAANLLDESSFNRLLESIVKDTDA